MSKGTVIGVTWNDAHYNSDEVDASDTVHRPWVYTTIGILVRSNEMGVTVAQDEGEDGKFRGRTFIPRGMVIEEWKIGSARPPRQRKAASIVQPKEEVTHHKETVGC